MHAFSVQVLLELVADGSQIGGAKELCWQRRTGGETHISDRKAQHKWRDNNEVLLSQAAAGANEKHLGRTNLAQVLALDLPRQDLEVLAELEELHHVQRVVHAHDLLPLQLGVKGRLVQAAVAGEHLPGGLGGTNRG